MRAIVSKLNEFVGQEMQLSGWVYHSRHSGKVAFIVLRDGTGLCQCVIEKGKVADELFDQLIRLGQESSLVITGLVRAEPRSPGGYELAVSDAQIICPTQDYPITPKEHGTDFLMKNRHLHLRSQRPWCIGRIRHTVIDAIRQFFNDNGFTLVDTPIFTAAAGESEQTLFAVDYFGKPMFLSQTGQLYLECAAMSFGKVYCFGPTFRAEKSKTRRHLTEFWMVEPEVAYFNLDDDMDLAEDFVAGIVARVVERKRRELEVLDRDVSKLEPVKKPFPRISYDEALEILYQKGMTVKWGDDIGGDEETVLSEQFDRPVLVHRYPRECKAFYMKADPQNPKVALCVDMIAPEGHGEIIGGGQREDNLDVLEERIREHNLPREAFSWYLDLRKYGSVPHAGFGLGIERTVGWICGVHHVRETIPFPRLMGRLTP